uniref:Uncharacterized protein n=1 Tax=Sphaerodactylus townsendi TaxID=933632 RepID=A0ACB8G7A6_9SAUR
MLAARFPAHEGAWVSAARRLLPDLMGGGWAPAASGAQQRQASVWPTRAPSPSGGGNVPSSVLRDSRSGALGAGSGRVTAATPLPGPASLQDEGRNAPEGTGAGFKAAWGGRTRLREEGRSWGKWRVERRAEVCMRQRVLSLLSALSHVQVKEQKFISKFAHAPIRMEDEKEN